MTKTFALNENNDIFIDANGNLSIVEGIEAVAFVCKNVAQTRLDEMIYEQGEGLPYFESVFNGTPNLERFRSQLRKSLLEVSGVLRVLSIVLNLERDVLFYEANILTDFGEITING